MGGTNKASGQLNRKVARYKKNRRHVYSSTPSRPFYTNPTLIGVGSTPGSGVGPGTVLTVTTDQNVVVANSPSSPLPQWLDVSTTPNLTVVSVVQVSPTEVALTFSGTIHQGDVIQIPDNDGSIRTYLGGFVQPGNYVAP